jgi:hypothetical protein
MGSRYQSSAGNLDFHKFISPIKAQLFETTIEPERNELKMRMNTKMNSVMKTLHTAVASGKLTGAVNLSSELLRLIELGFTVKDGAVLLKSQEKLAMNIRQDSFPDLTGYECFVNHIHIEDYISDAERGSNALLEQGLAFANKIVDELSLLYHGKPFKVIVATNESGCSVRFHLIRNGENWLSDDLDEYGQEAILVMEIPPI